MKSITVCFALVTMLLAGCSSVPQNPAPAMASDGESILVVIDDPRSERRKIQAAGPGYSFSAPYQDDPALHRAAKAIANDYGVQIVMEWPLKNIDAHCFVIPKPAPAVLDAISKDKRVRWVQPMNEFELRQDQNPAESETLVESFFSDVSERGRDIKLAVVDTGVDKSHPDLKRSRISELDFVSNRANYQFESHGTAVVGVISAKSADGKGVNGLANEAHVHLLRACWQDDGKQGGRCNTLTLSLALDAAIDLGVDVVNLSVSGPSDRALDELVSVLTQKDTLVVAAYDDKRGLEKRFPGNQSGVIYAYGVEASSLNPLGQNVLFAPRHALSLTPKSGYDLVSGHSIATPQVSAMAACLMEKYPEASRSQIVSYLREWLGENLLLSHR